MRKLSAYARRMRRTPGADHFDGAAWINTLQRVRPYNTEPPIGSVGLAGSKSAAERVLLLVRNALDDLLHHRVQPDNVEPHDLLAHAIDVGHIRAWQVQPDDNNPAHETMRAAKGALRDIRARWERLGQWGLAGPERAQLVDAIDVYEALLIESSPQQMASAVNIRIKALAKQGAKK